MMLFDEAEVQRLRLIAAAATRLVTAAGEQAYCASSACRAHIWWIVHRNGKKTPYNADGTNHFSTCPSAKLFHDRHKEAR